MFQSRDAAGRLLAEKVLAAAPENPVVLALPRGGVPVAAPVAEALGCPLDLTFVRKIGMPGNPELAAGAVVDGAAREVVFNAEILAAAGLTQADVAPEVEARLADIAEARRRILGGRAPEKVSGRTAIVVDDGLATGATARAALRALHNRGPLEVWLAVPVGPQETVWKMRGMTDRLIFLEAPRDFVAVGAHYADFGQVEETDVTRLLQEARARR
ncbi:phosphoribosyltransferase [Rhodovulum visakhapatnamense]|uniref:Putative phosphoribosyltransferase n=1 Tax=Rhodovulum visakhapatnamense TaxID=364297 RepID=A0A4R8G5U4_9RHOB|nr:phosphoribosyltransferase family protein [Rhodovulum visakhapatnamense]TDX30609.1 putative phosphoribosyltransferase [Rhodovulum visakhapatnamense]